MLFGKIKALVEYGVRTGLIEAEDTIYTRNRLLEALCEEDYADEEAEQSENLALLLDGLCDEAVKRGIIEDGATSRDLFDTKLMGLLTPRPSDVNRTFRALYKESPEKATDWFYKLCGDCNYIRRDRVARDLKWVYNDPRFGATILEHGEKVDGEEVVASNYKYFNRKAYCRKSERSLYGRADWCYGYWSNLRIIRYADIVLMHAEAACETNDLDEAKRKLEMVRARARNGQSVLPEIKTTDKDELREKIRHERRIELALEFERYFDLVRWGIAEDKVANFVVGKHEVFPLPQTEIDKSNGKLQQNPKY